MSTISLLNFILFLCIFYCKLLHSEILCRFYFIANTSDIHQTISGKHTTYNELICGHSQHNTATINPKYKARAPWEDERHGAVA